VLEVARDQVDGGAHLLDVCVALTERQDEAEQMARVVKLLAQSVETPLVIDTTEYDVVEVALERTPAARSSTRSTSRTAANASTRCCRTWSSTARPSSR
jgi:cobalamin-dependent methionine synthase I